VSATAAWVIAWALAGAAVIASAVAICYAIDTRRTLKRIRSRY
jgi:hypothetical protein